MQTTFKAEGYTGYVCPGIAQRHSSPPSETPIEPIENAADRGKREYISSGARRRVRSAELLLLNVGEDIAGSHTEPRDGAERVRAFSISGEHSQEDWDDDV